MLWYCLISAAFMGGYFTHYLMSSAAIDEMRENQQRRFYEDVGEKYGL